MTFEPYSAPWVFQDYAADHPGAPAILNELAERIVAGELDGTSLSFLAERHGIADVRAIAGPLSGMIIYYVRFALRDHALAPHEIETARFLKRALRVQEGDFFTYQREAIAELLHVEMARILIDGSIDFAEELHQVELQALFDLSYDEYLALTAEAVSTAVEELDEALERWRRVSERAQREYDEKAVDSPFLRLLGLAPHVPLDEAAALRTARDEARKIQRCLAALEVIARLHTGPMSHSEPHARDIPQAVKDSVWRRDQGACVQCGSHQRLEFDHIIPYARGGASTYRNVQLLCEPCNRKKSGRIGSPVSA